MKKAEKSMKKACAEPATDAPEAHLEAHEAMAPSSSKARALRLRKGKAKELPADARAKMALVKQ